jgi:hypothetical protein
MMQVGHLPREAIEARFVNEGLRGEVEIDGWLLPRPKVMIRTRWLSGSSHRARSGDRGLGL